MLKRLLAALLTVAMMLPLGTVGASAVDPQAKEPPAASQQRVEQLKNSALEMLEPADEIDPDERITAIIVVKTPGGGARKAPAQLQRSVQNEISTQVLDGEALEILHSYTTVTNGFAAVVPYGKLDEIRQLPGVSAAYAAPTFKVAPDMQAGTMELGGMANTSGYDGAGMVIAVLDTGLEVNHKSFQGAPENPALTQSDIAAVLSDKALNAEEKKPGVTASQVYRSAKVPFAFDYADNDTDVTPGSAGDHGVHVSGIAAANDGVVADVVGVAPEAQILVMKVFSSSGSNGATWDDVLAAADDAVALGADVINMSLGSVAGYSTPEGDEGVAEVFQNIVDAGVMLSVSAGNEYSSALGTPIGKGHALTANPDYGTVASPSTYAASMSVASVEKAATIESFYFTSGARRIAFNDTVEDKTAENVDANSKSFRSLAGTEYEYVVVPNYGEAADYAGLDVAGKLALVSRGSVEYQVKKEAAKNAGAAGIIVYNNEPGLLYMLLDKFDLPSAFISQADGKYLASLAKNARKVTVAASAGTVDNPTSGEMSDFSSWGVTPDLKLKPDITAPGGNIKSTTVNNGYTTKSGTSMSAPFVAGSMAVMKQYVEQSGLADGMTAAEKSTLINALLMNTADLVMAGDAPYSPRKQGAGSVDLDAATGAEAYITVPGQTLPKIELGDDVNKTGQYTMSFVVHNLSSEQQSYTVGGYVLTDGCEVTKQYKGKDVRQVTELPYELSAEVAASAVTVPAGGTTTVTASVTLTDADKAYLNENFENGSFVEGFITLTPAAGGGAVLSVPYMGFYGDWTSAPIVDQGFYWDDLNGGENWAQAYTNTAGLNSLENTISFYLGDNPYHDGVTYLDERNAISPNGDDYSDALSFVYTGLLRNARTLTYEIKDAQTDEVYYEKTVEYEIKSVYNTSYYRITPSGVSDYSAIDPWYGTTQSGAKLANGTKAIVTVTAELDYDKHASNNKDDSWSFPITIDTQEPEATNITVREENGKYYVDVTLSDDQFVANVAFANAGETKQLASFPVAETTAGAETQASYDVTGFGENLTLIVNDYACNRKTYSVKVEGNPDDSEVIVPTKTVLEEDFEDAAFPPDGWTLKSTAAKTWYQGTEFGSKMAICDYSSTEQQSEWLISPAVDLSAEPTEAGIVFDFYANYYWSVQSHAYNLKVKASTDGQSWEDIWQLWDWNAKNEFGPWEKTQAKVTIPEQYQNAQSVQFAFVYEGTDGTELWLDNIQVYVDDPDQIHTITATAGEGGSIDPSGAVSINNGKSRTFTVAADEGYDISDVKVDGVSVGAKTSYTFTNVTENHTIAAEFAARGETDLLIDEDFDECTQNGSLPEGWRSTGSTGSVKQWVPYKYPWNPTAYEATVAAYRTDDYTYSGAEDDRLITPAVDMSERTGTLSFRVCLAKGYHSDGDFYCAVEGTTDGTNWTQLWISNDGNTAYTAAAGAQIYADVVLEIPAALQKENAQFAFRYVKKADSDGGVCSIDNVQLRAAKPASGGDALLDEDFNASEGSLPDGWTQQKKSSASDYTWQIKKWNSQVGAYCSPDTDSYSDSWGDTEYGMGQDEYLISPALDLSGRTGTLTFQFSGNKNSLSRTLMLGKTTVTLEASADGGTTWTELWNAADGSDQLQSGVIAGNTQTAEFSVEIPEAFQKDGVKFAFRYQTKAGNTGGCVVFVDNIKLTASGGETPVAPVTFTITASAGQGGSITPSGAVNVKKGTGQSFAIAPSEGYEIAEVLVDGVSVGQVSAYTFENVTEAHTIAAAFTQKTIPLPDSINEDFNSGEGLPVGWTVEGPSASYNYETWKVARYEPFNYNNAAVCAQNIMFAQEQNEKLILPQINMKNDMQLSFDFGASYAELSSGSLKLTVKATLDKGNTWTELWNAKDHMDEVVEGSEPEDITGKGTLTIPSSYCTAEARFAFVFESSDRRNGSAAVDNVVLAAGGSGAEVLYGITVASMEHGTVTADRQTAAAGTVVHLTVTPDAGYRLKAGSLMAGDISVAGTSFTMPAKAVTVTALFEEEPGQAEGQYRDGVYSGEAQGRNGTVKVEVTIENGRIAKVDVIEQAETQSYWEKALAVIQKLLGLGDSNSIDAVDGVTSATISSEAILNAVKDALKDAALEDSGIFDSGSGTEARPYIIATIQQLQDFAAAVNGGESYAGAFVALGANLDLSEVAWTPIGRADHGKTWAFQGSFDGRGYTISHVNCGSGGDAASYEAIGLFGVVGEGGVVKDLNVQIDKFYNSYDASDGIVSAGGLAGILGRSAVIDHCSVTGGSQVLSESSGPKAAVGGLVGQMLSGSLVANSWTDVGLSYGTLSGDCEVSMGGICGLQTQGSLIANSASFGSVPGMVMTGTLRVGGLVGRAEGAIYNCYTTSLTKANVMGEYDAVSGTFVNNDATTAIGHLVGSSAGAALYRCYYDKNAEQMSNVDLAAEPDEGKTERRQATGWDNAADGSEVKTDESYIEAMSSADMVTAAFAKTLNEGRKNTLQSSASDYFTAKDLLGEPVSAQEDRLGEGFRTWAVTGERVLFGDEPVQSLEVSSVALQQALTVANGTAEHALGLPATVEVTLSDGTNRALAVEWSCADYAAATAGSYTFTGKLALPDGITNPKGLKATVVVTVKAAGSETGGGGSSGGGGGSSASTNYAVTVLMPDNGTVLISASKAEPGKTVSFTVSPDSGYVLEHLTVTDATGSRIDLTKSNGVYSFTMPASAVTISASFTPGQAAGQAPAFEDVPDGGYYADAVRWAVTNGITNGISENQFGPGFVSTRAQTVTFLWRVSGSPAPESRENPFRDISKDAYYYDAILWAVENGITEGIGANRFDPDGACTRAQVVTLLWRMNDKQQSTAANIFEDVVADAYYEDAVNWAVEQEITYGISENRFAPHAECTRAEIVTFLYRSLPA